jgi:pyrroline-5-carboxylate reductase
MKRTRAKATVFLGGGRITSALLAGLRLAGYNVPLVVHDRHPRKLRQLKRQYGVIAEPNLQSAVEQASLLIIAVRPDSVQELLKEIGKINHPLAAVSLAAGVPLARLKAGLGMPVRWARAMPSPVCRSGGGLTALAFETGFPRRIRQDIHDLFATVGTVLEIPETKFDAFTVTYSSSHGYHALGALASAAQKLGLDRKTALTAAYHALAEGMVAWRAGRISLHRLLHEAATPGGISASVMNTLDKSGYDRIIERGLQAGMARARKNAKPRFS